MKNRFQPWGLSLVQAISNPQQPAAKMNKIKLVVPPEKISTCQTILRHEFKDTLHCIRALQASGHWLIWEGHEMSPEPKNDRVAVLGDVIAKLILCEKWHATNHDKGKTAINSNYPSC